MHSQADDSTGKEFHKPVRTIQNIPWETDKRIIAHNLRLSFCNFS